MVPETPADFPDMIIIVGTGRSGTTYLTWTLRRALEIGFPSEPKFVIPLYRQLHRFGNLEDRSNLLRLVKQVHRTSAFNHLHRKLGESSHPEEILKRVQEATYRGVVYAAFQLLAEKWGYSDDRIGYKDPSDVVHLLELAKILPTSRFIHIIRDGRDVALSLIEQEWGPTNLYVGMRYWSESIKKAQKDSGLLEHRYFEFRFEDLILHTEDVGKQLASFINNKSSSPDQTAHFIRLINDTKELGAVQRWKRRMNYEERHLCEAVAGETLRACGYETEFKVPRQLSRGETTYYSALDFIQRVINRLKRDTQEIINRRN